MVARCPPTTGTSTSSTLSDSDLPARYGTAKSKSNLNTCLSLFLIKIILSQVLSRARPRVQVRVQVLLQPQPAGGKDVRQDQDQARKQQQERPPPAVDVRAEQGGVEEEAAVRVRPGPGRRGVPAGDRGGARRSGAGLDHREALFLERSNWLFLFLAKVMYFVLSALRARIW